VPRPSKDEWDTPGGPGGQEVLASVQASLPGPARALRLAWAEAVDALTHRGVFKSTMKPAEFNAFRRARLDEGITDTQLAASFQVFAAAVQHGGTSVRHSDLWRAYVAQWARWVTQTPAATQRPLRGRQGPTRQS